MTWSRRARDLVVGPNLRLSAAAGQRRSFDGLSLAAQEHLGQDASSDALFVFVNKRRNRLKVLWFDGNGHCILYKRLHRARFLLPTTSTIDARSLGLVLRGIENTQGRRR